MFMTILTILAVLIGINFALLFFSCNKTTPTKTVKRNTERIKTLSPEKLATNKSKIPYLAATGS